MIDNCYIKSLTTIEVCAVFHSRIFFFFFFLKSFTQIYTILYANDRHVGIPWRDANMAAAK